MKAKRKKTPTKAQRIKHAISEGCPAGWAREVEELKAFGRMLNKKNKR